MSNVLGVIVIARNGDREELYQDPKTYATSLTDSTALGASDLHSLGEQLREDYFEPGSPSYISDISTGLADTQQIKVLAKAGGEGPVVFDSAIALLQGLFPPSSKNKITLADGRVVTAPLGGYQYVPLETVEPANDRSLESWTDCPAFQKHIAEVHKSDAFKDMEKEAAPFLKDAEDFLFGRTATLENIWNVYDFMNTQLTYNQTYAFRLPPSLIDQARGLANFHEDAIFSDEKANGIGNIAGRTMMGTILGSLERLAFNNDPLQFMLVQTSYHPFISLFHQTEMIKKNPELKAIPNFGSALAIELRKGAPPDSRDFLRFKFKNGTAEDWQLVHVFGHDDDIPLTEFIYRAEGAAITGQKEWAQACGASSKSDASSTKAIEFVKHAATNTVPLTIASFILVALFLLATFVLRARKARARGYVRLPEDADVEVQTTQVPVTGKMSVPTPTPAPGEKIRAI